MNKQYNDQKCIFIAFSNKKTRPLTGTNQNLIVASTSKKRTMSAASLDRKFLNKDYNTTNPKNTILMNSIVQQKKPSMIGAAKEREQLYEENLQLKKQINSLKDQAMLLKSKLQVPAKPPPTQLQIKFQKELYWTGNKSYMVAGVKAQYSKLKQKYEALAKENKQLKVEIFETRQPESKVYIKELEEENDRLVKSLKLALSTDPINNFQKTTEIQMMENKIEQLDIKLGSANESIKEKNRKLQFLENRIIELTNKEHKNSMAVKKELKKKTLLEDKVIKLQQSKRQTEQNLKNQRAYFSELLKVKDQNENSYKELIQREIKSETKKLSEKVKHLEDQVSQLRVERDLAKQQARVLQQKQANLWLSQGAKGMMNQTEFLAVPSAKIEKEDEKISIRSQEQIRSSTQKRKTALQPNSQHAIRKRRVKFFQIETAAKILIYRLIEKRVDPDNVKDYFQHKAKDWFDDDKEFITMKQTRQILLSEPFSLQGETAELLARYLIEDCEEEYVYMDDQNNNFRLMVKSIIKSLIGSYVLLPESAFEELEVMLRESKSYLGKTLSQVTKGTMVIGDKKLFEVLKSLNIDTTELCQQAILAKLSLHTESLSELRLRYMFG